MTRVRSNRAAASKVALWAVAGLAAAVSLSVCEGLFRLTGIAPTVQSLEVDAPDSSFERSDNPVLGFELRAGYRSGDPDHRVRYAYVNAHGQRDVERDLAKAPSVRRVLLLGDSVVEGHGIANLDDTISRRMELLADTESLEVLNFGVSGYCTLAEIELLRVKGVRFAPDDVVLVFTANDFDDFNREAIDLEFGAERPAIVRAAFRRSHLFRTAAVALDLWHYGVEVDPLARNREAIGEGNVVEGLRLFRELAETHRFRPLVVVWPLFSDDGVVDPHPIEGDGGDLVVERLARTFGLPSVRLSAAFERDMADTGAPNPRRTYTVGDGLHPSPTGTAIAARAILDALDSTPRLDDPRPLDPELRRIASTLDQGEPTYARVHANRALALGENGRNVDAIVELERAIELEPDFAEAHNNLANLLRVEGRVDEALVHYRRALEIEPFSGDIHRNLASLLAEREDWPGAARHRRRVAEEIGADAGAWLEAADAAVRADAMELAIDAYERALDLGLDDVAARVNLGNAYAVTGRLGEALGAYRDALSRDPGRVSALLPASRIFATHPDASVRDPRIAVGLARQAYDLTAGADPRAIEALAIALAAAGETKAAADLLERGVALAEASGAASWAARFRSYLSDGLGGALASR